ncbi:MAG: MFS transporter [Candidatus Omnitrophota bacterium]|jgi:MFS family permease|nr:MAG: MFS transporter [Candidatus Omnitrophota bacterium]
MSKFREIINNRNFSLLCLSQIISQLGDRLGQMALIGFIYLRAPGSSVEIAKILSFTIIPVFLIGPIAGVYVDRWDRRRTLYISDLLRGLLVLAIPLFLFYLKSLIPIYIMVFLIFCVGRFFVPAKMSIIPDLVDKKDFLISNSLVNTTGMIAAVLGFGVSGILVEWLGAKSGFYLDALGFFISGSLIFFITKKSSPGIGIKSVSKDIVEAIRKSVIQEIKEGLVYFFKSKEIRFTAWVSFALWAALGSVYVVVIVFVQKTLNSATKDLGLLIMFLGIGLFAGSLIYGRFGQKISHYKIIFISLILSGIMLMIFATTLNHFPSFFVAAILSSALGFLIAPIIIASNTIVHNASDNEMMGKIFSSLEIVMHLGFLLFMFLSSMLAEHIPEVYILTAVGVTLSILGTVTLKFHSRIKWLN